MSATIKVGAMAAAAKKLMGNGVTRIVIEVLCVAGPLIFATGVYYAKLSEKLVHVTTSVQQLDDRTVKAIDKLEARVHAVEQLMMRP